MSPNSKNSNSSNQSSPGDCEMGVLSMSPNSRYGVKGKRLPLNFHERVLELEIMIDRGNFDIDTINDLILLYSVSFLVLRIY